MKRFWDNLKEKGICHKKKKQKTHICNLHWSIIHYLDIYIFVASLWRHIIMLDSIHAYFVKLGTCGYGLKISIFDMKQQKENWKEQI